MIALALVLCCALVCGTFLATLRTADRWLAHVLRPAEPAAVEALRVEVTALKELASKVDNLNEWAKAAELREKALRSDVDALRSRDALGRM